MVFMSSKRVSQIPNDKTVGKSTDVPNEKSLLPKKLK